MPVQPVISMDQIVIIVAFLMMLFLLMWFVKRNRGGIAGRLNPARRMQHIEDMSLAPQQRLHLIEVDGRTFLVHAGKGHAATFMPVDSTSQGVDQLPPATRRKGATAEAKSAKEASAKPKSAFAAAVAQARRNNPSLRLGK
jgi:flagellar biogenesis protein FliO